MMKMAKWHSLWEKIHLQLYVDDYYDYTSIIQDSFSEIIAKYTEPCRAYHNLEHLGNCLVILDSVFEIQELKDGLRFLETSLAIWCHDIVYKPTSKINEENSSIWANKLLATNNINNRNFCDLVTELIIDTKHNRVPRTLEGKILVDIDMSILGNPPSSFCNYDKNIRKEYLQFNDQQFYSNRLKFFYQILAKEKIFYVLSQYEEQARNNIENIINIYKYNAKVQL